MKESIELFEYLKHFHDIKISDFELLTKYFDLKYFQKNEYIITPGQIQRHLYFVKKGVQMSFFLTEEKNHVIAFTYPPNICAIPESFQFQEPSKFYLKCLSDSEFYRVSYTDLMKLFDQSQSLERLFRRFTEYVLAGMINRHLELHSLSMAERFKLFCNRSPHLLQMVPHKYIARYLNIDPTNFSKLFNSVKI